MLLPAKCPECGGLIEVNSEQKAANCQHCGSAFIVEEAVNNFNTYFNVTNIYNTSHNYGEGAIVNVYEDISKDFVIEAGVLKEYHGSSVDVVIPDEVSEIGENCFSSMKIKSVVIPDGVTNIGVKAFESCCNLSSINLPNSIECIGKTAFYNCTSIESVKIPDNVTSIGYSSFRNCTNLKSIEIPIGVTNIDESAFSGCTNLASFTIPDSVTEIGTRCFENCKSLTSIIIPESVTLINYGAFLGCTNLVSVVISKNTAIAHEAFFDYWKSKNLCTWCGGEFQGLITKKCSKCRLEKNY